MRPLTRAPALVTARLLESLPCSSPLSQVLPHLFSDGPFQLFFPRTPLWNYRERYRRCLGPFHGLDDARSSPSRLGSWLHGCRRASSFHRRPWVRSLPRQHRRCRSSYRESDCSRRRCYEWGAAPPFYRAAVLEKLCATKAKRALFLLAPPGCLAIVMSTSRVCTRTSRRFHPLRRRTSECSRERQSLNVSSTSEKNSSGRACLACLALAQRVDHRVLEAKA